MLFLLLVLVVEAQSWSFSHMYNKYMPPINDASCGFTRIDAMHCLDKYVDVDPRDGGISPKEAKLAIRRYSSTPIRALFWGLGTDEIFKACDKDKNGLITAKDWMATAKTCMPTQENMCSLQWFCKRVEKLYHPKTPRTEK